MSDRAEAEAKLFTLEAELAAFNQSWVETLGNLPTGTAITQSDFDRADQERNLLEKEIGRLKRELGI